jgi:DNA/RNA-binding domain of Phe-tRNA-synthetase-like protein
MTGGAADPGGAAGSGGNGSPGGNGGPGGGLGGAADPGGAAGSGGNGGPGGGGGGAMFGYDEAVTGRYPAIRAGVIHVTGVSNGPSPPGLLAAYTAEQRAACARLATTPIADLPSIAAWRRAFTAFGVKPTQCRNAAEALLRRLAKQGDIPALNTLVDIGNLVSIRYAMPVAVFDRAGLAAAITVRFATGAEQFADLGSSGSVHPDPGEVIFTDDAGVVAARRWCWRQSAHSAAGASTTEALIVTEGLHDAAATDVTAAVSDLTALLAAHQPRARLTAYALPSPAAERHHSR